MRLIKLQMLLMLLFTFELFIEISSPIVTISTPPHPSPTTFLLSPQQVCLPNNWTIIKQLAWNKSSLLLKNILQNTQILQVFTINIRTESIYIKMQSLGLGVVWKMHAKCSRSI